MESQKISVKVRGKIVEINLENLYHNFGIIKGRVEKARIFPVVKSNAYGHGIRNIVPFLENYVDGWCVGKIEEAKKLNTKKPVIILKGLHDDSEIKEIEENFFIVVVSKEDLEDKLRIGCRNLIIKFDTGMGRLGILPEEIHAIRDIIDRYGGRDKIVGAMTHFAYSDFSDIEFVVEQKKLFDLMCDEVEKFLGKKLFKTISNSAGTLYGIPDFHKDIVRPGICLYGISPFGKKNDFSLKPVMSVKTRVIAVKEIPKGWSVGYSRRFISAERVKIAVLDIGYADGLPRKFWEEGFISIKGRKFKIVGVISMDMTCVLCDDGVKVGDEAYIIGESVDAYEIAEKSGTITYEVLCSLGLD